MLNKSCPNCETFFETNIASKIFCSSLCSASNYQKESMGRPLRNLTTGTVGAIAELRVGADLLAKGYEVFRALSASCSTDLVILKNSKFKRIEVRTAWRNKKTLKLAAPRSKFRSDHFAFVLPDEIVYEPLLEMESL